MSKTFATPEYEDKLLDELLSRITRDIEIKESLKWDKKKAKKIIEQEMLACFDDCVYFIEHYLFTDKNPAFFSDRIGTYVPYLLFDYQVETVDLVIKAIEDKDKVFLEKSRQMGVSWLFCAIALWWWLFHDWKILFLSQKEDFVDKLGDMQSLFQKIRFMTAKLPKWMLPKDFSIDKHMPRLRIYKPDNSGTWSITGESASTNAGTGGTYKMIFLDEFSKMQNARSINTAVQAASVGSIIYNGTPLGKFNEHYKMRKLALKKQMKMIRLHWKLNPMYTDEWFITKTRGMLPEDIAQEYEINYEASVTGRVYPNFANMPTGDCIFGKFEYDPYLPLYVAIDNSHGGQDKHAIIIAQVTPIWKIRIIDSYEFPSWTSIDDCASFLAKQLKGKYDDNGLDFYERYKSYKTGVFIADPYDSNATWNDTSIIKIYRNYWITLNLPDRTKAVEERIRICHMNMNRIEVNVDVDSDTSLNWDFVSEMQNVKWKLPKEDAEVWETKPKPVHSDFRTSFEYLVNFIIEAEESMGIVWGVRQRQAERTMIQRENIRTGDLEWVLE